MASYRHPVIAPEGKVFIYGTLALAAAAYYVLGKPGLLGLLPVGLMLWLFRDPRRPVPSSPLAVVCPVDGKVMAIEEQHDPWLDRPALHIAIRMSPLGMNSLRSVTEGKVVKHQRSPNGGRERAIHVQTDEQDDVIIVLRPGRLMQRLSCHVHAGERVGQGQRCGHILFGADIDIYLPANSRSNLQPGQVVRAGSDVIGEFIHG
ncbi:MAG: phosphatidylserine decarboxylase [Gammaproteobacteria bacterium]|nr:phosphatidylserine decarboxylase [Gammaproteobacteria bacterium]MDH5650946.1 phosphatidylserine decarboxylase [Gammaproteobacteria bacterium]